MQLRCVLHRLRVPWTVLAVALVSLCVPARAESALSAAQLVSDAPPVPADFDGDRIADPLTLDRTGWQLSVEVHRSRTQEVSVLVVDPALSGNGSLTVRDLDNDGDTDLLWKSAFSLAPPAVTVWFNDGAGRFAPLLSLHAPQTEPTPGRSLRKDSFRSGPHYEVLSSKRFPSPVTLFAGNGTQQGSPSAQRKPLTVVSFTLFLKRPPSDRAPPLRL
jgi:hypothetical protein